MSTQRKGYILPYTVIYSVQQHIRRRLTEIKDEPVYIKHGPAALGDNGVPLDNGETSIEVFCVEHAEYIRTKWPEAKEVNIIWK